MNFVCDIEESPGFWMRQTMHDGREIEVMLLHKPLVGKVITNRIGDDEPEVSEQADEQVSTKI